MTTFLEYTDWSFVQVFVAQQQGFDVLKSVLNGVKLQVKTVNPTQISELLGLVRQDDDLFGDTVRSVFLIDLAKVELSKSALEVLASLDQNISLICFNSEKNTLSADDKKLWKGYNFDYQTLKKLDEAIAASLISTYAQQLGISFTQSEQKTIISRSLSYFHLLEVLEYAALAESVSTAITECFEEEKPLPFMYSFKPDEGLVTMQKWWNFPVDDIQLGLSLIFTKLEKSAFPKRNQYLKKLIETDEYIKTRGGISATLWWKLFLYSCAS